MSTTAYTQAAPGRSARERARSARMPLIVLLLVAAVIAIFIIDRNDSSTVYGSIRNPAPEGAQALARVASAQGLSIREIDKLSQARITDPAATTLILVDPYFYTSAQTGSVAAYPGDLVVLGWDTELARGLGVDLRLAAPSELPPSGASLDAQCSDRHATAAGSLTDTGLGFEAPDANARCFLGAHGAAAVVYEIDGRTVTFVASSTIATNRRITENGNAAYLLRLIGGHENAVWYIGGYDTTTLTWTTPDGGSSAGPGDDGGTGGTGDDVHYEDVDFLPAGFGNLLYALGLALVVVVWWRARRFGPLVTEPLPVIIHASEAVRGRARMYRASRAVGRAGASLRAATASRVAKRLGVSRYGSSEDLLAAMTTATARPRRELEQLFYGPPPATEAELKDLAIALDHVESEVHRL